VADELKDWGFFRGEGLASGKGAAQSDSEHAGSTAEQITAGKRIIFGVRWPTKTHSAPS
jgi:hypothetical protein